MNWQEILKLFGEKLQEALKGVTDKDAVRKLLDEATNALPKDARQHLIDHGMAQNAIELRNARTEASTSKTDLEKAKADLAAAETKLAAAGGKGDPDLQATKDRLEQQLKDAEAKYKADVAELRVENDEMQITTFLAKVAPKMKELGAKSPRMIELLMESPRVRSRVDVIRDKKTGKVSEVKIKRKGQKDGDTILYLTPPTDQELDTAFAADLYEDLDTEDRGSPLASGSGVEPTGSPSDPKPPKGALEAQKQVLDRLASKPNAIDRVMGITPAGAPAKEAATPAT